MHLFTRYKSVNRKYLCFHGTIRFIQIYYRGSSAYVVFKTLEKQLCIRRKPCKRRSDLVLNGQMRLPKKPCYLENCVLREPCKQRTACVIFEE